ncbi:hypothetical protein K5B08_00260, partial [Candidatus Carsonella ruddii]|nr:hypothetical protein [Candidatus Carsonella ruddii]
IIEHKGTGMNMVLNSIKNNININSIFEALIIRIISKNIFLRNIIKYKNKNKIFINLSIFLEILKNIFLNCKLICYIQGFNQLIKIFKKYNWKINFNNLIKSYLNSCIIDSNILFYLINFKKNFFFKKIFLIFIKKIFLFKKIIILLTNINIVNFLINSCYNFLLIIIYKNYNFKLIQFERNYFGNHILKFI